MSGAPPISFRIAAASSETGVFPSVVALAKKYLPEFGIRVRRRVRVGDEVGDGLRNAGEMLAVGVVGARQIGRAERRAEPVGEIGEIAVGDEGVLERLLLLIGKGQKRRLPDGAGLDAAGDGEVRGQRRFARVGCWTAP